MKLVRCKECGRQRQHHAFGLCSDCYQRVARLERSLGFCVDPECPFMGTTVPIVARGLCQVCYSRNRAAGELHYFPRKEKRSRATETRLPGAKRSVN